MKQQAAAGGQPRPGLPNGPSADPFNHHHAGPSNGSCSSSPSEAKMENRTDHTQGPGGGDASNGNVPYLQPNSLPHNRTAAGQPSTNSTWSPSPAEETWKSQQLNTNTQVTNEQTATHSLLDCVVNILLLLLLFSISLKTSFFFYSRGLKKVLVHVWQVPMENLLFLLRPLRLLRPPSFPLLF